MEGLLLRGLNIAGTTAGAVGGLAGPWGVGVGGTTTWGVGCAGPAGPGGGI